MQLIINGAPRLAPDGGTVADLVADLPGAPTRGLAVAVNGVVAPRSVWVSTELADGDTVEILTAAQGG